MSEQIMQLSTFEIERGKLETFKSSIENAVTFSEENGPQLLVEVYIDEENMQAHSCQIQPDSESILAHWKMSDPYIDEVMHNCTMKRLDIYGQPNVEVMEGLQGFKEEIPVTVTPHFIGFNRFQT